jgi:hypothetical protein
MNVAFVNPGPEVRSCGNSAASTDNRINSVLQSDAFAKVQLHYTQSSGDNARFSDVEIKRLRMAAA